MRAKDGFFSVVVIISIYYLVQNVLLSGITREFLEDNDDIAVYFEKGQKSIRTVDKKAASHKTGGLSANFASDKITLPITFSKQSNGSFEVGSRYFC